MFSICVRDRHTRTRKFPRNYVMIYNDDVRSRPEVWRGKTIHLQNEMPKPCPGYDQIIHRISIVSRTTGKKSWTPVSSFRPLLPVFALHGYDGKKSSSHRSRALILHFGTLDKCCFYFERPRSWRYWKLFHLKKCDFQRKSNASQCFIPQAFVVRQKKSEFQDIKHSWLQRFVIISNNDANLWFTKKSNNSNE